MKFKGQGDMIKNPALELQSVVAKTSPVSRNVAAVDSDDEEDDD